MSSIHEKLTGNGLLLLTCQTRTERGLGVQSADRFNGLKRAGCVAVAVGVGVGVFVAVGVFVGVLVAVGVGVAVGGTGKLNRARLGSWSLVRTDPGNAS